MVGGWTAFGSGGYDESALDKLLPVDMDGRADGYYEDIEFASDAPFIVELVATRKRKKKKSSKGRRKLKTVPIDNRIEVLAFKNLKINTF